MFDYVSYADNATQLAVAQHRDVAHADPGHQEH
jgi:hypothetical protein